MILNDTYTAYFIITIKTVNLSVTQVCQRSRLSSLFPGFWPHTTSFCVIPATTKRA